MLSSVSTWLLKQESWAWCWCSPHRLLYYLGTDVDVLAYTMPKGPLSLAEVCDWPPGIEGRLWLQNWIEILLEATTCFKTWGAKEFAASSLMLLLRYGLSISELWCSFYLGRPSVLWVLCTFPKRCHRCNFDPKDSAGRTSPYLQPFCQKDWFWVVLRYLGRSLRLIYPQCWCPKDLLANIWGWFCSTIWGRCFHPYFIQHSDYKNWAVMEENYSSTKRGGGTSTPTSRHLW